MKRIFTLHLLLLTALPVLAQPVLNEIYTKPGNTCSTPTTEFFEMYNGNQGGGNAVGRLDCYYVVVRWQTGTGAGNEGFYVIDFPASAVITDGYYTVASANAGATQTSGSVPCAFTPSLNWNNPGITAKYTWNGATYTSAAVTNLTNLFDETMNMITIFVYNGSTFVDGLVVGGGGNTSAIMSEINSWPSLTMNIDCAGSVSAQTINFSGIQAASLDLVNQAAGTNNGYAREYDGNCGPWNKTASPPYHTPELPNPGSVGNADPYWDVLYSSPSYPTGQTYALVNASLSNIQNVASVTYTVYRDGNLNGVYDAGIDPQFGAAVPVTITGTAQVIENIQLPLAQTSFVLIRAASDCYYTQNIFTTATLPVSLLFFNAEKTGMDITVSWQTERELNNRGFEVQRKTDGDFSTIAFVPAQTAPGSGTRLYYQYIDRQRPAGSLVQYRLKQVDINGEYKYSGIRVVKMNQQQPALSLYPNPSTGTVNIILPADAGIATVMVESMNGAVVKRITDTPARQLRLDGLQPGVYTVRLINRLTGIVYTEKLVVR